MCSGIRVGLPAPNSRMVRVIPCLSCAYATDLKESSQENFRQIALAARRENSFAVCFLEIGPLTASPNLGVSTGYACKAAPCNRTNLNSQRAKQFSRQAARIVQPRCSVISHDRPDGRNEFVGDWQEAEGPGR